MKLFEQYILKSLIKFHFIFLSIFISIVLFMNFWYFAAEWFHIGLSMLEIMIMLCFFVPAAIMQANVFASGIALFVMYGQFSLFKELDAMRSLGVSWYQILRPIILFSLFNATLVAFLAFEAHPRSILAFQRYFMDRAIVQIGQNFRSGDVELFNERILYAREAKDGLFSSFILVDRFMGHRLILWARDASIQTLNNNQSLVADDIYLLMVDNNISSVSWYFTQAKALIYPLEQAINMQNMNPSDILRVRELYAQWREYWDVRSSLVESRKIRLEEIRLLLLQDSLDGDREMVERERDALIEESLFSFELLSLMFIILLRLSHILLTLLLPIIGLFLLEYYSQHKIFIPIILWFSFILGYWVVFYGIAGNVIPITASGYWLYIPFYLLALLLILHIIFHLWQKRLTK